MDAAEPRADYDGPRRRRRRRGPAPKRLPLADYRSDNGQIFVEYVHRTTKPERRAPYVPISFAELDDLSISGDALTLLARLRRYADDRETDGILSSRELESLRVLFGYSRRRFTSLMRNLAASERIHVGTDAVYDVNFIEVCKNRVERQKRREQWAAAK